MQFKQCKKFVTNVGRPPGQVSLKVTCHMNSCLSISHKQCFVVSKDACRRAGSHFAHLMRTTTTTTTTVDRYPLKSLGPGRLLATFLCLMLPSLRPLMFESVFPLIMSLSLVGMWVLVFLLVFFNAHLMLILLNIFLVFSGDNIAERKKTKKKKKGKLPKNYVEGADIDKERWLPMTERSTFRGKRKKNRKDVGKGPQGGYNEKQMQQL